MTRPKIATLGSLGGGDGSDDDQDAHGQNFFVGGGKNSGMLVEDPNAKDLIQKIQRKAEDQQGRPQSSSSHENVVRRGRLTSGRVSYSLCWVRLSGP
jgi:hypothetical protein